MMNPLTWASLQLYLRRDDYKRDLYRFYNMYRAYDEAWILKQLAEQHPTWWIIHQPDNKLSDYLKFRKAEAIDDLRRRGHVW